MLSAKRHRRQKRKSRSPSRRAMSDGAPKEDGSEDEGGASEDGSAIADGLRKGEREGKASALRVLLLPASLLALLLGAWSGGGWLSTVARGRRSSGIFESKGDELARGRGKWAQAAPDGDDACPSSESKEPEELSNEIADASYVSLGDARGAESKEGVVVNEKLDTVVDPQGATQTSAVVPEGEAIDRIDNIEKDEIMNAKEEKTKESLDGRPGVEVESSKTSAEVRHYDGLLLNETSNAVEEGEDDDNLDKAIEPQDLTQKVEEDEVINAGREEEGLYDEDEVETESSELSAGVYRSDGTLLYENGTEVAQGEVEWWACDDYQRIEDEYARVSDFSTHYQEMMFYYGEEDDDVCIFMDQYLHTCASTRPHYHEVFVHYAARFVKEVKRIIFIGGGDSKVLHEALKYPSVELVVGLELDQQVPRSSFYHFGTQPHFDDPKVEWYFGDAAKSLSVLPRSYYGSFDLVIVDILTEVASELHVNEEHTLLEAAMLLMKPEGILIKNEDEGYVPGSSQHHANYAVDLVFHDVPHYCLQVFVAVSNSVDFLTAEPVDHGVETLYLKGLDEFEHQFDSWYNYGVEAGRETYECGQNESHNRADSAFGVLLVLEAEKITATVESILDGIKASLHRAGLTQIDTLVSPLDTKEGTTGFTAMVLAKEGYVTARCVPHLEYCAVDIFLHGSSVEKMVGVQEELVSAMQSQKTSAYRFVLGGMLGSDNEAESIGPPSTEDLCNADSSDDQDKHLARKHRRNKEPEEFDRPQPASLHSYDNGMALTQWKSQKSTGGQILVQFRVARFWAEEEVLVLDDGVWHQGKIAKFLGEGNYDVVYENDDRVYTIQVGEDEIKRVSVQTAKERVEASLASLVNRLWQLAEQNCNAKRVEGDEFGFVRDATGDGLTLAYAWDEGTLVVSWDGQAQVTANFFLSLGTHMNFWDVANELVPDGAVSRVKDIFPRGPQSVVVFAEDVEGKLPYWA